MSSFSQTLQQHDPSILVTIDVNGTVQTLTPEEYQNKTITEVFSEFAQRIGTSVDRITSYTINGQIVDGDAQVLPGLVIRGNVKTDSKQ